MSTLDKVHSYLSQELKPINHQLRRTFVNWKLKKKENDFFKNILWTMMKRNKHNCRIWDKGNPQVMLEKPLHLKWVTVWFGFWVRGPYFFQKRSRKCSDCNRKSVQINESRLFVQRISLFNIYDFSRTLLLPLQLMEH